MGDYWDYPWGDGGGGQSSGGLSSLFNTGNLDKDQYEKLKKEYEKMLEECTYKAINNGLLSSGIKLGNVLEDPNLPDNAVGAVTSDGDFKVKDVYTTGVNTFKHEWIHLYQKYLQGIEVHDSLYTGMAEFEVAAFRDIEIYKRGDEAEFNYRLQDVSLGYTSWIHNTEISEERRNGYIDWIKNLSTGDTDLSNPTSIEIFKFWAQLFGQYGPYRHRGYEYSNINYPLTALEGLIQILTNCK